MVIYKITNKINNKIYVGKFGRPMCEFKTYYGSGTIIKRAILKYGLENFTKEIIDTATTTPELNEKEIYWISKLDAKNVGYNLTDGGDGADTSEFIDYSIVSEKNKISVKKYWDNISEEEYKQRCEAQKGTNNGMFGKEGYWKGKSLPIETIEKMVSNRRSYIGDANPNWQGGISKSYCGCGKEKVVSAKTCISCRDQRGDKNPFYNKSHSDETKKKLSEKRKGKKPSNIKPFYIGDTKYLSLMDAEKATGVKATTIRHRIISKNKKYVNYYYDYSNN